MEFELFFNTDLNYNNFKDIIVTTFAEIAKKVDIRNDEDGYYLSHDYFSITIFKETFGLDMIEEDYNLKVTSSISIDLFAKAVEEGMRLLLKVIGSLLKKIEGDSIFLGDSSTIIFKKVDNVIYTYNHPEQYYFKISFDDLGEGVDVKYIEWDDYIVLHNHQSTIGVVHNPVNLLHEWAFPASVTPITTPMPNIRPLW